MATRRRRRDTIAPLPERFRHGYPDDTDEDPDDWKQDLIDWANAHPTILSPRELIDLLNTAPDPDEE